MSDLAQRVWLALRVFGVHQSTQAMMCAALAPIIDALDELKKGQIDASQSNGVIGDTIGDLRFERDKARKDLNHARSLCKQEQKAAFDAEAELEKLRKERGGLWVIDLDHRKAVEERYKAEANIDELRRVLKVAQRDVELARMETKAWQRIFDEAAKKVD